MTVRSVTLGLALSATLALSSAVASAQIDPDDSGLGYKLGVQQRSNSGEVGTVTLFSRGGGANTLVVLELVGEPKGDHQPAHIHRGKDCDSTDPKPAFPLAPVVNGISRTIVHAAESKLRSGNYSILVHADGHMDHYVACGHLY